MPSETCSHCGSANTGTIQKGQPQNRCHGCANRSSGDQAQPAADQAKVNPRAPKRMTMT